MSTTTEFKIEKDLSVSSFGRIVGVSKTDEGKFRSFGVRYGTDTVWINDENWYNAWTKGEVVPGSITIMQVQRLRNKLNEDGTVLKVNGRTVTEPVTEEIAKVIGGNTWVWEMTSLKTKSQLQGEDEMEVWMENRAYDKQLKRIEIAQKYAATAAKAAETAPISDEQLNKIDLLLNSMKKTGKKETA